MAADAILVVRFVFTFIWQFFTSWYIPGTNVTPAGMAFFLLLAAFVLRTVRFMLGKSDAFSGGSKSQ